MEGARSRRHTTTGRNDRPHPPVDAGMRASVRMDNGERSNWFDVTQGPRQGCVLYPLLVNIFLAAAIEVGARGLSRRTTSSVGAYIQSPPARGRGGQKAGTVLETVTRAVCGKPYAGDMECCRDRVKASEDDDYRGGGHSFRVDCLGEETEIRAMTAQAEQPRRRKGKRGHRRRGILHLWSSRLQAKRTRTSPSSAAWATCSPKPVTSRPRFYHRCSTAAL